MNIRSRWLTYAGVACIVAGFAVIAFTWGRVAALTAVPLQLPHLVSGGLTALGLILVGILLINIQTKLADATRRDRQIQQLSELLEQIRTAVLDEPPATAGEGWPAATAIDDTADDEATTDDEATPPDDDDTADDGATPPDDGATTPADDATTKVRVVRRRSNFQPS